MRAPGVRFEPATANRKLAPVGLTPDTGGVRPRPMPLGPFCATTAVSMASSCPSSCPWLPTPGYPGSCYASSGFTSHVARALDREAEMMDPVEVIRAEAQLIKDSFRGGPVPQDGPAGRGRALRLHTIGDIEGRSGAEALADAAQDWIERQGSRPFSYTHRWAEVHRRHWGPISVLASIEDPADLKHVARQGYAPALVVESFASEHAFKLKGWKFIPCPYEAHPTAPPCTSCRLCYDAERLLASNIGIAFALHGPRRRKATGGPP